VRSTEWAFVGEPEVPKLSVYCFGRRLNFGGNHHVQGGLDRVSHRAGCNCLAEFPSLVVRSFFPASCIRKTMLYPPVEVKPRYPPTQAQAHCENALESGPPQGRSGSYLRADRTLDIVRCIAEVLSGPSSGSIVGNTELIRERKFRMITPAVCQLGPILTQVTSTRTPHGCL